MRKLSVLFICLFSFWVSLPAAASPRETYTSPLLDGLISYWNFDETSGDRMSQVGDWPAHEGAINPFHPGSDVSGNMLGRFEYGSALTVTNQYGGMPALYPRTITGWFHYDGSMARGTSAGIICQYVTFVHIGRLPLWCIEIDRTSQEDLVWFTYGGSHVMSTRVAIREDRMIFFALQFENDHPHGGNTNDFWMSIDGGEVISRSAGEIDTISTISDPLTIGNLAPDSVYHACKCYIDEVGMWDRNLSRAEISALFNSGLGLAYPFSPDYVLYPSADNTIIAQMPDVNNGLAPVVEVGKVVSGLDMLEMRGLLQFDLSGIPANDVEITATLRLRGGEITGTQQVYGLNMLSQAWDETSSTWRQRDTMYAWGMSGLYGGVWGAEGAMLSDTIQFTPTVETTIIDVSQPVKKWLSGSPNNGWLIRQLGDGVGNGYQFRSRHDADELDPVLMISIVPATRCIDGYYICNGSFEDGLRYWQTQSAAAGSVTTVDRMDTSAGDYMEAMIAPGSGGASSVLYQLPVNGVIPPEAELSFAARGDGTIMEAGLGADISIPCIEPTPTASDWTDYTCDLSAYAGRAMPVAFRVSSGTYVELDHVHLTGAVGAFPDLKPGMNDDSYIGFRYDENWSRYAPQSIHAANALSSAVTFSTYNMERMYIGTKTNDYSGRLELRMGDTLHNISTVVQTIDLYRAELTSVISETEVIIPGPYADGRRYWQLVSVAPNGSSTGQTVNLDYIRVGGGGVFGPGMYDDTDSRIYYQSSAFGWYEDGDSPLTYSNTIHYSYDPYGVASFNVHDVTCLQFWYSAGPGYGRLDMDVDGSVVKTIDQYAPLDGFQSTQEYCGISPDQHVITLRPNGKADASTGVRVTLDGLKLTRVGNGKIYLHAGVNYHNEPGFTLAGQWQNYDYEALNFTYQVGQVELSGNTKATFYIRDYDCFAWVHKVGPDQGIVSVRVDGVEVAQVDSYAASDRIDPNTTYYEYCGLTLDNKVELVGLATKNASASDDNFSLRYVDVYNTGSRAQVIRGRVDDTYRGLVYTGAWAQSITTDTNYYQQTVSQAKIMGDSVTFQTDYPCVIIGYHADVYGGLVKIATEAGEETFSTHASDGLTPVEYHYCYPPYHMVKDEPYDVTITFMGASNPLWSYASRFDLDYIETVTYQQWQSNASSVRYNNDTEWLVYLGGWWTDYGDQYYRGDERRSATDAPARIWWEGKGSCLRLAYSAGPDRGIAGLWVDGALAHEIDMSSTSYRPATNYDLCGMDNAHHFFELRATGNKSAASTDSMIALDYIKVGDSSIIIDNPGDTGTDLPAFDVGCSRPSDWLSPSQWIEYTWCRLVAFVTPNSVNAMQQDTMGAYLVRKEPVATMYEYKDAMDQLNTGIQTIDWSDSGVTASGGYDADWFRIFETFGSVYNGEGIDLTGGPSYDVACDAQLPGGMAGGFASGVCYGMSLLENVGFTWWLQWIANIWFIVFLMFYIVKNWVNKASA